MGRQDDAGLFKEHAGGYRNTWNPGPYYWHGNEPDIHAAYLFNEAGRPDLTRKWVRWVLEHKNVTGYDGLDRTWIRHSEMAGGGVLSFEMSDTPEVFK